MAKIDINNYVKKYIGFPAKDKITGTEGVITSICFDVYGCIQVLITPKVDKDGKRVDSWWYDLIRIDITSDERVLPLPDWQQRANLVNPHPGPAEKPSM